MPERRFLEDFVIGQRFESPASYEVERERMVDFAREFDRQPIHIDEPAAAVELFGGLVASGWLTLAATARLVLAAGPLGATPTVGVSIDNLRFIQPVRAGDRLIAEAEVLDVRASRAHLERGYLVLRIVTRRRSDSEPVLTQDWTLLMPRRA